MIGVRLILLATAITLLTNIFPVDASSPISRREFPLINETRTLNSNSLGPSQSSTSTNVSRALITPSPILNSTSPGIFNNASFAVCSAIAASRQGRPFKRGNYDDLIQQADGIYALKRNAGRCEVDGITVQLAYFPSSAGAKNASHPSTLFVPEFNKTFTSPSVYMLWQTITAHDVYFRTTWQFANATKTTNVGSEMITCVFSTSTKIRESSISPIGPILTKVAHPFELSQLTTYDLSGFEMSSMMDYPAFVGSMQNNGQDPENPFTFTRMGLTAPSSQLQLSHLHTDCPATLDKKTPPITRMNGSLVTEQDEAYLALMNSKNHQYFRCNPFVGVLDFNWLEEPSWKSCSVKFNHRYWGMPDPPYALEFDTGLTPTIPITPPAPGSNPKDPITTQPPAAPISTGSPGLASNTSPAAGTNQPVHTNTPTAQPDPKSESQPENVPRPGNIEHNPSIGGSSGGNNAQPNTKPPADVNNQKPDSSSPPGSNTLPGSPEYNPSDSTVGPNNAKPASNPSGGTAGGANNPETGSGSPENLANPVEKPASNNQDAKPNPGSNPASNKVFPQPGNVNVENNPSSGTSGANSPEPGSKPPSNLANPVENHGPSSQNPKSNSGINPAPNNVLPLPGQEIPVSAVSVAIIGTDIISALPGGNGNNVGGFILPGGLTIKPGSVTTLPPNVQNGQPVICSVNGAGNLVVSSIGAPIATTIAPPAANAAKGGLLITPLADPNKIVYMGQTLTNGGPLATIPALQAVVTYGPLGLIVQYPNGVASTISVSMGRSLVSVTTRARSDGAVDPPVNNIMTATRSLDSSSKSSVPGQIFVEKPTSNAGSKNGIATGNPLKGESVINRANTLLCAGLCILIIIAGQ